MGRSPSGSTLASCSRPQRHEAATALLRKALRDAIRWGCFEHNATDLADPRPAKVVAAFRRRSRRCGVATTCAVPQRHRVARPRRQTPQRSPVAQGRRPARNEGGAPNGRMTRGTSESGTRTPAFCWLPASTQESSRSDWVTARWPSRSTPTHTSCPACSRSPQSTSTGSFLVPQKRSPTPRRKTSDRHP
jgi:hypothetical protein